MRPRQPSWAGEGSLAPEPRSHRPRVGLPAAPHRFGVGLTDAAMDCSTGFCSPALDPQSSYPCAFCRA